MWIVQFASTALMQINHSFSQLRLALVVMLSMSYPARLKFIDSSTVSRNCRPSVQSEIHPTMKPEHQGENVSVCKGQDVSVKPLELASRLREIIRFASFPQTYESLQPCHSPVPFRRQFGSRAM